MRTSSTVLALLGAACVVLSPPLAGQGRSDTPRLADELEEHAELAGEAEGWHAAMEADADAFFAWARNADGIVEAEAAVARYLEDRPDDPAALVLRARLLQLVALQGNVLTFEDGEAGVKGAGDAPVRVRLLLRRAVEVAPPGWPEPHYRLGRVYLQPRAVEGPEGTRLRTAPDSALEAARRALAMDPEREEYRRLVGEASLAAGDTAAALEHLPGLEDELRLLARIRDDLERVPMPPGAAPGSAEGAAVAEMMSLGRFRIYPVERVRSWLVPLAAPEVETFYRERWEGFRLLTGGSDSREDAAAGGEERTFLQHFRLEGERLVPARDMEEADDRTREDGSGGILLMVVARDDAPERIREPEIPPELAERPSRTEIVLVSLRREPD